MRDRGRMRDGFVPCNGCTLCCRRELVVLMPEDGDPAAYETRPVGGQFRALAHKPDGSCVYLGPGGCTIYARRPTICRAYDCGAQFRQFTRAQRRQGVREGWLDAAILKRGREIEAERNAG
jgi:uncharacterized protein